MSPKPKVIPLKLVAADPIDLEETSLYEKQKKLYPRWVTGYFNNWRIFFVLATQLFFYGVPWLKIDGRQALLFDLAERKFFIFGLVLLPQDLVYLTALLVICAFGLFLWTTVGGRLWCGYSCPQTVYTEIFLWVERWAEGDRPQRIKLDQQGMSAHKLARKGLKHTLWIAISLWTGFTFVGYFVPMQGLSQATLLGEVNGWVYFWMLFYAFATYGNAGWLREQVCKYMCPYARFQSAMFDADTLVISYDAQRGDPRGRRGRHDDPRAKGLGDCIDCQVCVQVCPVGIDIRNGLQYECIACGACIDACDDIMDKMDYPRGLIRYTTQNALDGAYPERAFWSRLRRPRVVLYGLALAAVVAVVGTAFAQRQPLFASLSRDRGVMAREAEDGLIENVYLLQLDNADDKPHRYQLSASGIEGIEVRVDDARLLAVEGLQTRKLALRVRAPVGHATARSSHFLLKIAAEDLPGLAIEEKAAFLWPR
ncbi:cytochrome c oxidase accessory protein CcoG [Chitinimonas sp.]|uniref:cytochrome c oxidase accessory protein CcoG n=1 Tax=Chitinimonas sp. TaxID=1934313 RepID=UPI002F93A82E